MIRKKEKLQNLAAAFLCAVIYMIVLSFLIPFIYGIVDDRSMMEFVSGQYLGHPDPHTIFMGYWYSSFLAALYQLTAHIDWYALCFLTLQICCLALILYRILDFCKSRLQKLLALIAVPLVFGGICLKATVQLSFTTTAALLGITLIFWYETCRKLSKKDVLLLLFAMLLICEIRSEVLYMILPLCAVFWIFRCMEEKRISLPQMMIPAAVVLVLVIHGAGEYAGYGSGEWRAYETYNQCRSQIYDFPDCSFLPYNEAPDFYQSIGIEKKSRARTLINYDYTADDRITPDFFRQYIEAFRQAFPSQETMPQRIFHSIRKCAKGILTGTYHWENTLAFTLYGILGLWYLFRRKWFLLGKTVSAAGIQLLMWIYLIYAGRMPDRVIYSMNLMLLTSALLLWAEAMEACPFSGRTRRALMAAPFLVIVLLGGVRFPALRQQNLAQSRWNENVEDLKEYCMSHPENFYFGDVTSFSSTTWNVRLWRDKVYVMNYISLGDWMSYSPIWQEKLARQDITSVKETLYGRENTYLICSFDKGLEYLKLLYDHVSCEEVWKISGFHIYDLTV